MIYGAVAGTFLSFCSALFLLAHSAQAKRLLLLHWAILGLGGLYGAAFTFVVIATHSGLNDFWGPWFDLDDPMLALVPIYALVLMVGLFAGWAAFPKALPSSSQMPASTTKVAWLLLLAAVVLQGIYTAAYGGYLGIFEHSRNIRIANFVVENRFSFLQPFGALSIFSSLIFASALFDRPPHRPLIAIGLFLSVVFSTYVLLSWAGRQPLLIYAGSFILPALYRIRASAPTKLFIAACCLPAFILGAYVVAQTLNLSAGNDIGRFFVKLIAYPHASDLAWLNASEIEHRYFIDFVISPMFLLPSSIWTIWHDSMDVVNTTMMMGAPKGVDGVTGSVPADLLTIGILQTPVAAFGVIVTGFLVGVVLRFLQYILDNLPGRALQAFMSSYVALAIAARSAIVFDPSYFVPQQLMLMISFAAIFIAANPGLLLKRFTSVRAS